MGKYNWFIGMRAQLKRIWQRGRILRHINKGSDGKGVYLKELGERLEIPLDSVREIVGDLVSEGLADQRYSVAQVSPSKKCEMRRRWRGRLLILLTALASLVQILDFLADHWPLF